MYKEIFQKYVIKVKTIKGLTDYYARKAMAMSVEGEKLIFSKYV